MSSERHIVLIGAGGHAGVIADACVRAGRTVAGYLAPDAGTVAGLSRLGGDDRLDDPAFLAAHNFILAMGGMEVRQHVGTRLAQCRAQLATIVHPSAIVGRDVELGGGTFVAAGAVLNPGARIGRHAIINTRASVDHDCVLEDYVQVAPGATLGGGVVCGEASLIGIGAAVRQTVRIGRKVIVGVGAAVVSALPDRVVAVGVPARPRVSALRA